MAANGCELVARPQFAIVTMIPKSRLFDSGKRGPIFRNATFRSTPRMLARNRNRNGPGPPQDVHHMTGTPRSPHAEQANHDSDSSPSQQIVNQSEINGFNIEIHMTTA